MTLKIQHSLKISKKIVSQGSVEWHWYLPAPPGHMPTIRAWRGPRSNTAATDWRPRVLCTWATVHCGATLGSLPCHHLHQPLPSFPAQGYLDQDGSVFSDLKLCPLRSPTPQTPLHLLLVYCTLKVIAANMDVGIDFIRNSSSKSLCQRILNENITL